jgi:elongation factor Tu
VVGPSHDDRFRPLDDIGTSWGITRNQTFLSADTAVLFFSPEGNMTNDRSITVRANIRLLPTVESGRTTPIKGSYRPNHNFFGPDDREMTVGFIDFPSGTELRPGDSIDLPITFWSWPGLEGQIYPGRKWRIQEGAKLVGIGTVLEVLPADRPLRI